MYCVLAHRLSDERVSGDRGHNFYHIKRQEVIDASQGAYVGDSWLHKTCCTAVVGT